MAEEITTSPGGGVMPNPGTPVTGTPAAPGGVTPQPAALTSEEMAKRVADLERSLNNAKEENDRHSKRLFTYEKQEKDRIALEQAAKDAQLSEIERVKKQHADAEARIKQQQQELVKSQIKLAAIGKGIQIDTDIIASYLHDKLDKDENGMPTNLDALLDALIQGNPVIAEKKPDPATSPAQTAPTPQAPAVPAMHPSRAGRSDIPSAGSNSSGRRYNLTDRDIWTAPGTPSKWQP